ncbi:UDP-N-acetylmuramate--L-alanine ligase [Cardinium endosymbiont of Oedothorax gibbosus]|uniref:UDP-N-acetylmuramate--L-alanine ligase n=1 Tax=Cardinium endosymbiont of Oedothorax gibbosus TaxID=931101 RepID=UPI002025A397|nr:UDP-N-acetylmuramate--L-alanine ligase [Cardinium endosymbiont of Oedothorax gibbosus]CAH2559692.1 UDP-N-acetylmuramate--L-alanine ligase [Cardinium endosymbiont of Oedothorax gibbosus]
MLPFNDYAFIYFIGIGGIGMSALAQLCAKQGYQVFGYDQYPSAVVLQLEREGITIYCNDTLTAIPEVICNQPNQTLVIYTPAIPTDSPILNYFKGAGYKIQSRAEVLGIISKPFATIAVAGTHGKTTTSAMIAHILYQSDLPMVAFVGGMMRLYDTNLLYNRSLEDVELMVAEADEFNRSFLHLQPTFSIVTAADADHPETYTTTALMEDGFIEFIQKNQKNLLIQHRAADQLKVCNHYDKPFLTYGLDQGDVVAGNVAIAPHQSTFDYLGPGTTISNVVLPIAGLYNIENALAAITICLTLGITETQIRTAIANFPGIKRRFSFVCNHEQYLFIDDYAHHPVEISALLSSVKKLYPNSAITAIFQPHLFSRTQAFYKTFATSLSLADQVFILPIYPAREVPIPAVTAQLIFDELTCKRKALVTMDGLLTELTVCATIQAHQIILTIGAGDIGQAVSAIATTLQQIFGYTH